MKIALCSFDPLWLQKGRNLVRCRTYVQRAAELGCVAICFPESTFTGFTFESEVVESRETSSTLNHVSSIARESGVCIVFGAFLSYERGFSGPYNCAVVVDKFGSVMAEYQKIHLFSHGEEHSTIQPGTRLNRCLIGSHNAGLAVCYDLRFPAMFQSYAADVEMIIVLANWPAQRVGHWRALSAARAIETQTFLVGVNRTGVDGNGQLHEESSSIWSPDGTALSPYSDEFDGILKIYDLDFDLIHLKRSTFPQLKDRVLGLDYPHGFDQ